MTTKGIQTFMLSAGLAKKTDPYCRDAAVVFSDESAVQEFAEVIGKSRVQDMPISVESVAVAPQCSQHNSASRERDQAIDAVKGLAIVGVLFVHMNFTSRLSETTLDGIGVIQQFLGWCVVGFFFCAGVLAQAEAHRQGDWRQHVLRRAKRLLLPCLVFSVTYKSAQLLIERYSQFGGDHHELPRTLLEWGRFFFVPVGPQFYFLPYLFFISLLSVTLVMSVRNNARWPEWIVLTGCIVFYAMQPIPLTPHGPSWILIPGYVLGFWLGLMASQGWQQHRVWWGTVFASVLIGCVLRNTVMYAHFLAPVLVYWCFQRLSVGVGLSFLGKRSGAIYVWHAPLLLPACSIIAAKILSNGALQVTLILGLGIGVSIAGGEVVNRCRYLSWYRF